MKKKEQNAKSRPMLKRTIEADSLNTMEKELIAKLASRGVVAAQKCLKRLKSVQVMYVTNGDFTICKIRYSTTIWFLGVAKRNARDKPDHQIGQIVAMSNALKFGEMPYDI